MHLHGREAADGLVYERHRPDDTRLYRLVEQHYPAFATHLAHKAGFTREEAATGAVTLVQRFGSALNLNIRLHMLCLDGVYTRCPDGGVGFRRVKAPDREELEELHPLPRGAGAELPLACRSDAGRKGPGGWR